jgi:protein subunit release factor A
MCPLSLATLRARIIPKENKEKNRKKKKKRKPILQGCGADLSRFLDKKNYLNCRLADYRLQIWRFISFSEKGNFFYSKPGGLDLY